jgi:large subunit ribosomal protein L24
MVRRWQPGLVKKLTKQVGIRPHRNGLRYKMHVRKGDLVQVISGDDKGKVGEILRVLPETSQVVVAGVNMRTKHVKPQREGEKGQIIRVEAPIHSSKVMLYSQEKEVASRVCHTYTADGRKVRMLKKTGELLLPKPVKKKGN